VFPGYETLNLLDHGGMGEVYRVRDASLDRTLAVKVLLWSLRDRRDLVHRFLREAQITAQLQHPGIPPVHEVGRLADGRPFLAMKLIDGQKLADLLRGRPDLAEDRPRWVALLEQVCQTVAYAHSQGVIHRDLKPGNVMVGAFGEVQVMDWGLAKKRQPADNGQGVVALDAAAPNGVDELFDLSQAGDVLGTYGYMAPEQARGEVAALDERCDVFALGAMLCVMLTGQPPFVGSSKADILRQAEAGELAGALARLEGSGADAELIAIAKHCLAASVEDRPANAQVVAAKIAEYRAGVEARLREAETERAASLVREAETGKRRRVQLISAGIVAVVLIAGITGTSIGLMRAREEADQKEKAREREKIAADGALAETKKTKREFASSSLQRGLYQSDRGDVRGGMLFLAHSLELAEDGDAPDLAQAARSHLAALHTQCNPLKAVLPHADQVLTVKFSADGKRLLTGCADQTAQVWDIASTELVDPPTAIRFDGMTDKIRVGDIAALAFSPDGRTFASGCGDARYRGKLSLLRRYKSSGIGHGLRRIIYSKSDRAFSSWPGLDALLWDTNTGTIRNESVHLGQPTITFPHAPGVSRKLAPVWAVAFSPNGKILATASGLVRESNGPAGLNLPFFGPIDKPRNPLDPLGEDDHGHADFWDVATGKSLRHYFSHGDAVLDLAFSPDGKHIVTASADQNAQLWNAQTFEAIGGPIPHHGPVIGAGFSPDGELFLTISENEYGKGTVQLWDTLTRKPRGPALVHALRVLCADFSPDGRSIVTGTGDPHTSKGEAQFWDIRSGKPVGLPLIHQGAVHGVALRSDGRYLATACSDKAVRLWEIMARSAIVAAGRHHAILAWSPDGKTRLHCPSKGQEPAAGLHLLDEQGKLIHTLTSKRKKNPTFACFSPDGRQVAVDVVGEKSGVELWDAESGKRVGELALPGGLSTLSFSPDGSVLIAGTIENGQAPLGYKGALYWCDATTGKWIDSPLAHNYPVLAVAFSSDGRWLISGSGVPFTDKGKAQVWDVAKRQPFGSVLRHSSPVRSVAFSFDNRLVATGADDGHAMLWDVSTSRQLGPVLKHRGAVRAVCFSPDGRTLVTGSDDHTARLWDIPGDNRRGQVLQHEGPVRAAAFSPDGSLVATGGHDYVVRLWQSATGKPFDQPLQHDGPIVDLAFTPRASALLTRSARINTKTTTYWYLDSDSYETTIGAGWDNTGYLWKLPRAVDGSVKDTLLWSQVLTGLKLDKDGTLHVLNGAEWLEKRQRLPDFKYQASPREEIVAWHLKEAGASVTGTGRNWFTTLWHLRELTETELTQRRLLGLRGRAYAERGHWDLAHADLTKAINEGEDDWETRSFRGLANARLKHWDQAIVDLTKGIDQLFAVLYRGKQPVDDNSLLLLLRAERGSAFLHTQQWNQAIDDFTKVLKKQPQNDGLWLKRGRAHAALRQWDKAIADFTKVITLQPGAAVGWNERGVAYFHKKEWERAIVDFSAAIERDSTNAVFCRNRADAYAKVGQPDKAKSDLAEVVRLEGKLTDTVHNVDKELALKGKLDKATPALIYRVRLKAGVTYVIDMVSPDTKALDPYLVLQDADGKTLAEDDDSGGDLNAQITFRAPADGVYRLRARSYRAGRGPFTLTVRLAEQGAVGKEAGKDSLAALRQKAFARVRAKAFADAEPLLRECLKMAQQQEPDGWVTFHTQSILGACLLAQKKYQEAEQQLREGYDGLRKRAATIPNEQRDWVLQQAMGPLSELFEATRQTDETRLQGKLTAEKPRFVDEIKLVAGKAVVLLMNSEQFDALLRLEDENGKLLVESDDIDYAANKLNSLIWFMPPADGVYRIVATSYQNRGRGEYEIVIRRYGALRAKE
jgi:WD40 repeat protein/tetratricopeptide (TPR) repeat protein